jgi:hypothetical protein
MMAIRRLVLTFVAATLVGVFLPGCRAARPAGRRDATKPPERTEGSKQADSSGGSRPPESTLSYGGDTITGALGTYCWGSASGSICVDKAGYPVSEETLTVPTGSTLTFAYGGKKLDSLSGSAHRTGQGYQLKEINGGGVLVPTVGSEGNATTRLQIHRFGTRAHVAAELPVGKYVVAAFIRGPQGDAVYGFHVVVE